VSDLCSRCVLYNASLAAGLADVLALEFLDQAGRQTEANDFRNLQTGRDNPIEWHFHEREAADFAWDLFEETGYLPRIRVCYTPYGRPDDNDCYPDP
jgi:hypothetical protein